MNCFNEFCIYNKKDECTLIDEIEINVNGMCDSCMTVTIRDDELQVLKDKQLKRLDDSFDNIIT